MSLFDPSKPFGVACHDAGGANQIAAMLERWNWQPDWIAVDGPAIGILKGMFPDIPSFSDFSSMGRVAAVLTGTGWASELEHTARQAARQIGVRSIAVLDHWANYPERFRRKGLEVLPDEIWVVDVYAEAIAQRSFGGIPIVLKTDCYSERELMHIEPITAGTPNIMLYLLEPVRSDWGRDDPGEFQALRFFLKHLPEQGFPSGIEIHLRPHPSEAKNKYAAFIKNNSEHNVRMAKGSLVEAISNARWVAGYQTYAMTLALAAGRRVISSIPPWAPPRVLPHSGIEYLRDMVDA